MTTTGNAEGTGTSTTATATAPATTPTAPAVAAAVVAAPATPAVNAVSEEALRAAEAKGRNGAFAELRRNGGLKKSVIAAMDGAGAAASAEASGGGRAAEPTPSTLRALDRAVTTIGMTLDDAQWRRAERDFLADKPLDAVAWLRSYYPAGAATAAAAATAATTPAAAQNARPASGAAGAPARGTVPLEQQNPLEMPPEDIAALVARIGPTAFKALVAKAMKGVRVSLS